jgi:hypothetical protein
MLILEGFQWVKDQFHGDHARKSICVQLVLSNVHVGVIVIKSKKITFDNWNHLHFLINSRHQIVKVSSIRTIILQIILSFIHCHKIKV